MHDVFEGVRFRVSCPHHSTPEDSSPVMVSNINISQNPLKAIKQFGGAAMKIFAVNPVCALGWRSSVELEKEFVIPAHLWGLRL